VAFFGPVTSEEAPVAFTQDLGLMLYDVFDLSTQNTSSASPLISMFRATIRNGVVDVPEFSDASVLKPRLQEAT
jgi:hypothetical protein